MTDESIIAALRAGDGTAIGEAIVKYSRLLWRAVGTILRDMASEQDMEECVADVFVYLWQNPDRYDPARGPLKTWLRVVARSQALDKYRELARRRGGEIPLDELLPADGTGIADGLIAGEAKSRLDAAIRSLGEPDREILLRRYYGGQKPREIARALKLPVKRVENGLYRAKLKLRKALTD